MDLKINAKATKVGEDIPTFNPDKRTKVYARRWYILGLYVMYMLCNSSQWLQYSIISNVVGKFYGISTWQVNLTSIVMMACYLPLALPAANLMDRINLRWTAIIGSFGTALGAWVKVLSARPDQFYLTLTAQTIVAIAQVFMLSVPQKLSSVWFGEREVSSACSIGVFGFQLGIVIGFFLPPILVKNHTEISHIGEDLYWMFVYFAVFSTMLATLVLFKLATRLIDSTGDRKAGSYLGQRISVAIQRGNVASILGSLPRDTDLGHLFYLQIAFQAQPQFPPTRSQAKKRSGKSKDDSGYVKTLKRLFFKKNLLALFITTGVNNGCFNGFSTLLSQIFLEYFPGKEEDAGRIGVTMVICGMIASVTFGFILDRTKKFKFILIFVYYMSAAAMATFTILLLYSKAVLFMYFAAAFVGTFLCGFTAVSFDVATELTYPECELIVGTLMNMMSLLFTIVTTLLFGYINENLGYLWGNIGFVITLTVGATLMLPIRFDLKRTTAQITKWEAKEEESLMVVK